jgi:hypothetical protein
MVLLVGGLVLQRQLAIMLARPLLSMFYRRLDAWNLQHLRSGLLPPQNADDVVRQSARSSCAVIRRAKKAADVTCFASSVYSDQTSTTLAEFGD